MVSETANELLYEEYFTLTNIEKTSPYFQKFYSSKELRTCPNEIMEIDDRFLKNNIFNLKTIYN